MRYLFKVKFIQVALFMLLFLRTNAIYCQSVTKGELKMGVIHNAQIIPGEKHRYNVKLQKDNFVFFKLYQEGIDLVATVYDADGIKIEEIDEQNDNNSPELITFTTNKAGIYSIIVHHANKKASTGYYKIKIEWISKNAKTLQGRVDQLFIPWNNQTSPGAAISIIKDGEVKYKKGYGLGNLEYNIPIGTSTIFHLASVSKQVTAFAILLLAKEGKLSLDDEVGKYIKEFPDFGKKITIRHLICHTSGLRDHFNLLLTAGYRFDDVITKDHIMKLVSRQKNLNHEPGEEFLYNNTGYILLAEIVAKVSGESFPEFTRKNIFEPLKMNSTFFNDDHERVIKNFAYSYSNYGVEYKKRIMNFAYSGSTSLLSSIDDFSHWVSNLENPTIGDKNLIHQMDERCILNSRDTTTYASGLFISNYKGLRTISHGGFDAGYSTAMVWFPDQKFSVIVFCNLASIYSSKLALKIADIYLENEYHKDVLKKSLDVDFLKKYEGKYKTSKDSIISVILENGKLFLTINEQKNQLSHSQTRTGFSVNESGLKVAFNIDSSLDVQNIVITKNGNSLIANKIAPIDPPYLTISLEEYVGKYYSEELCSEFDFINKDGKLTASHPRIEDIELLSTNRDTFSGSHWILGRIEFIRDQKSVIIGLRVSNERARNMWFQKVVDIP